jgi:hypothetical protein
MLITELIVALTILVAVMIPVSFSFFDDQKVCRTYYYRSVAMEIVDGEMEVLRAGEWRNVHEGSQPCEIHAQAAKNLPPGRFVLTRTNQRLCLEWLPNQIQHGGRVTREMEIK